MTNFAELRERMIERQIAGRGLTHPRLLHAFRSVPREQFVDPARAAQAYDDNPLPIAAGQTISQPYIVALMIAEAGVGPDDRVLEVGAGSGYAAAVLGQLSAEVFAVERHPELAQLAAERVEQLGYRNVHVVEGDGTLGWPPAAPFDVIIASATGSHVPATLTGQLAFGGRLVMPVGKPDQVQRLVRVCKDKEGKLQQSDLGPVRFVPLIGEEGWHDG